MKNPNREQKRKVKNIKKIPRTPAHEELFPTVFEPFYDNGQRIRTMANIYKMWLKKPYDGLRCGQGWVRDFRDLDKYQGDSIREMKKINNSIFSNMVSFLWLRSKFAYEDTAMQTDGTLTANMRPSIIRCWGVFMRSFVGVEPSLVFGSGLEMIEGYVSEMFPDFWNSDNPLEKPLEFPFENLNMAHLYVVRNMDERIFLLRQADKEKMKYMRFLDFITNWVYGHTQKYGEKYQVQPGTESYAEVVNLELNPERKSDKLLEIKFDTSQK